MDPSSETPAHRVSSTIGYDDERRGVMVPMRNGVKQHTVLLVPPGAHRAPILLTRTPDNADDLTTREPSAHLGPRIFSYDNATDVIVAGGDISVVQDVRGKYKSEGDDIMNRPLRHAGEFSQDRGWSR